MHNFNVKVFSVLFRVQVVCPDNQEFDPCQEWKFFSLPAFTAALIHLVSYPVETRGSFCTGELVRNRNCLHVISCIVLNMHVCSLA